MLRSAAESSSSLSSLAARKPAQLFQIPIRKAENAVRHLNSLVSDVYPAPDRLQRDLSPRLGEVLQHHHRQTVSRFTSTSKGSRYLGANENLQRLGKGHARFGVVLFEREEVDEVLRGQHLAFEQALARPNVEL